MSDYQTVVPCRVCNRPTRMTGTKLCDGCWELERRIGTDPASARKILNALDGGGGVQRCSEIRHAGRCVLNAHGTAIGHKFTPADFTAEGL